MRTTVLFVDGRENTLQDLRLSLAADFQVCRAENVEGVLTELADQSDVVLVTDADTALGQSRLLASVLKERFPTVPRVLLCRKGALQATVHARNGDRVDAYLTKPCDARTLSEALKRVAGPPRRKLTLQNGSDVPTGPPPASEPRLALPVADLSRLKAALDQAAGED